MVVGVLPITLPLTVTTAPSGLDVQVTSCCRPDIIEAHPVRKTHTKPVVTRANNLVNFFIWKDCKKWQLTLQEKNSRIKLRVPLLLDIF
jgi:hypothetical protein